jgi:hypothetical protein
MTGKMEKYQVGWIPILEHQVQFACAACGPVYFVAKNITSSREFPAPIREFATGVCYGLMVFTAGRLVGEFIGYLSEA